MTQRHAEVVLVGAPGSAARAVARALAQAKGWTLVDVDELRPSDRGDLENLLALAASPDRAPRLLLADTALVDPLLRRRLYRGRRVVWLDAPVPRLVSRARLGGEHWRASRRDPAEAIEDHLATMAPYYAAGERVDATGSTPSIVDAVLHLLDQPSPPGTLVVRADTPLGVMEIGEGIVARGIRDALSGARAHRAAVLTDAATWQQSGPEISSALETAGLPFVLVDVPVGESSKTIAAQTELARELARKGMGRWDPIVALGDDRVCEATAFLAGVYLRGVPLITVPTTTLGQIDLGIGGKGAVNLDVGRNLLGIFHQSVGTVVDVRLLRGEDPRQRRAAMAEAVKYALLGDQDVFAILERAARGAGDGIPDGDDLEELIERCSLAKLRIVVADERDTAETRIALNLGHTLSHALETATEYEILHGEAVAYGLRAALAIGLDLGETPPALAARASRILDRLELGTRRLDIDTSVLPSLIAADKKRKHGHVRWVLARGSGVVVRHDVPADVVARSVLAAVGGVVSSDASPG